MISAESIIACYNKLVVMITTGKSFSELDHKESWAPKNWYFWTVVLEKTLESSLDYKEIQPVHPKGNQSWIFTLATWCEELTHWKRPWCWEKLKVGGEGDDRGWDGITDLVDMSLSKLWELVVVREALACCSPWGHKESDTTKRLN